jgi:hypothetical protein
MKIRTRAALFTPATHPERIPKASEAEADLLFIDLEDSVAPADKLSARHLFTLSSVLTRAVRMGKLATNPIRKVDKPRIDRQRRVTDDASQRRRLRSRAEQSRQLQSDTGSGRTRSRISRCSHQECVWTRRSGVLMVSSCSVLPAV